MAVYPTKGVIHPSKLFLSLYFTTGSILFMTLTWTVSSMLRIICERVSIEPNRLQNCYRLIYGLINELSHCFGPFLLIMVAFFFVWTINGSFHVIVGFREKGADVDILLNLLVQLVVFPFFVLLLFLPNRIEQEVC